MEEEVRPVVEQAKELQDAIAAHVARSSGEEQWIRQRTLVLDSSMHRLRDSIGSEASSGLLDSKLANRLEEELQRVRCIMADGGASLFLPSKARGVCFLQRAPVGSSSDSLSPIWLLQAAGFLQLHLGEPTCLECRFDHDLHELGLQRMEQQRDCTVLQLPVLQGRENRVPLLRTAMYAKDLGEVAGGKFDFDVVGHYSRPEVLSLIVRNHPSNPVTFAST